MPTTTHPSTTLVRYEQPRRKTARPTAATAAGEKRPVTTTSVVRMSVRKTCWTITGQDRSSTRRQTPNARRRTAAVDMHTEREVLLLNLPVAANGWACRAVARAGRFEPSGR